MTRHDTSQLTINEENLQFWKELCGTTLANKLGIEDNSLHSLKRFDEYYLNFYYYLYDYIPFDSLVGQKVLEIGLGYGTLSQKIIESGAQYTGLDISEGPVNMVFHRASINQHIDQDTIQTKQASILECPFEDNTFDYVIAIGCYHHTGDFARALAETYRVLKPGGTCIMMVYYAYSYRRMISHPIKTLRYALWDKLKIGHIPDVDASERAQYDASADGRAAPETQFFSKSHIKRLVKHWTHCHTELNNIGVGRFGRLLSRDTACRLLGPLVGRDVYCKLIK